MSNGAPITDATILDGAVVVQMLNPSASRTFQEYGEGVFASYVLAQLEKSNRIDLVWDVYQPASLKAPLERRGERAQGRGWVPLLRCQRTGVTSFEWTRTKLNCLPSCHMLLFTICRRGQRNLCNKWKWSPLLSC